MTDLQHAKRAAMEALATMGISENITLLRRATSCVFLSPESKVVAKVVPLSRPDLAMAQQRSVDVTTWISSNGVPVPQAITKPIFTEHFIVSLWQYYKPTGSPSPYQAGKMLRLIHEALLSYPGEMPVMDLTSQRDPRNVVLSQEEEHLWKKYLANAIHAWEGVNQPSTFVPLHGDYHSDNLLVSQNHLIVLDWDGMRKGPVAWDGVTIGPHRSIGFSNWKEFSRGYGQDLQTKPQWDALKTVSAMMVTRWLLEQADKKSSS